jgi:hypothetical protein
MTRYRSVYRGIRDAYCCFDTHTRKQESVGINNADEAQRLVDARNEAVRDVGMNPQVTQVYLQRMAASYPLANGREDTHRALVVVGIKSASKCITGRAHNDGGRTCEYEVEQGGDILQLADALPGHGRQWKSARKTLRPTKDGYEESLEVDAGEGFINYYNISMRKTSSL